MTVLEMQAVRKEYGEVTALDGLDLTVEHGEIVAVLGPNGAGKTTTFELLLGLIRPSACTVRVLGEEPGRRLVELARSPPDEGHRSDMATSRWAAELGVPGWFEWQPYQGIGRTRVG